MPLFETGFVMIGAIMSTIGETILGVAKVIGESITSIFGTIKELAMIEGAGANLISIGVGLGSIAIGLAALTAGGIVAGIGSLFGGDSWIDQIKTLNDVSGDNILNIANGFEKLAESLEKLNNLDIDVSKLTDTISKINDVVPEEIKTSVIASSKVNTKEQDSNIEQNKPGTDSQLSVKTNNEGDINVKILQALETLIGVVSQPTIIKLNDQFITKLDETTNLKKQFRASIDNSYGNQV
jgi:hypothetical protein